MENCDTYYVDFWRKKANEYEWMYTQQKEIAASYRKLLEELQDELQVIKIRIDLKK